MAKMGANGIANDATGRQARPSRTNRVLSALFPWPRTCEVFQAPRRSEPGTQRTMPHKPQHPADTRREARLGVLAASCAYAIWGLTPLYFKAMLEVPALEIIGHRVVWSVVFLLLLLRWKRQLADTWQLARDRAKLKLLALTSALVIFNWFLFVWAVNAGRVLDTSLGYFMMPLMYVLLGRLFFA